MRILIKQSKNQKALNALLTVFMFALLIKEGTPWLLDYLASNNLPIWAFWLVSAAIISSAPEVYLLTSADYESGACCD